MQQANEFCDLYVDKKLWVNRVNTVQFSRLFYLCLKLSFMNKTYLTILGLALFTTSCGDDNKKSDDNKEKDQTTEVQPEVEEKEEEAENPDESTSVVKSWSYDAKKGDNDLYGFVDENDNWIVEPQFQKTNFSMRFGMGAVRNEDYKWGFVNEAGEMVIDYQYRFAGDFTTDGTAPVKVETGSKVWRYVDKTGKEVLEVEYDQCGGFWDGLAYVSNSEGAGFIDKSGKIVIPMIYTGMSSYTDEDGNGTYFNKRDNDVASFKLKETGLYGLVRNDGEALTDFIYDHMPVYAPDNGTIVVQIGGLFGAINHDGEEIVPVEYDRVSVTNLSNDITAKKGDEEHHYSFEGEKL